MPVMATYRPQYPPPPPDAFRSRLEICGESGRTLFAAPFAPRETNLANFGLEWVTVERPGRKPLLSAARKRLPTLQFSIFIGSKKVDRSIEPEIRTLRDLAGRDKAYAVRYSRTEAGLWNLTSVSMQAFARSSEAGNEITQAIFDLTFTRASEANFRTGPVKGGHKGGGGEQQGGRTYTVKEGDTLHKIAVKVYDDPTMWRAIADKNKIRKPKKDAKLKPGTKLKLPVVYSASSPSEE